MALLVGGGLATFTFGLLLAAFAGDLFGEASAGADVFSRSLVGHHALRTFLERAGLTVVVARNQAAERAHASFPLLLAEPGVSAAGAGDALEERLGSPALAAEQARINVRTARGQGAPVVFVLPKWAVSRDEATPGFIDSRWLLERDRVRHAFDASRPADSWIGDSSAGAEAPPAAPVTPVVRVPVASGCAAVAGPFARKLTIDLEPPAQLLAPHPELVPVVACTEGLLLAHWRSEPAVYVVADPDLLNNAGLGRGDHALLVHDLFLSGLGAEGVVVDEGSHGYGKAGSVLRRVFTFPLVVLLLHGLVVLALLSWRLATRFGAALPPPDPLPRGKGLLIDNTAALLLSARQDGDLVRRYFEAAERNVARRFAAPGGAHAFDLAALAAVRGETATLADLRARLRAPNHPPGEVLRLARDIRRFERTLMGLDTAGRG